MTCKSLIVRNLATNVTENDLKSIFNLISSVQSLCFIQTQCALVEFQEHRGAEQVLFTMNKRPLCGQIISIEWNYENARIFVNNLNKNITGDILLDAFRQLHAIDARIMENEKGRYGVLSFPTVIHAEKAAREMNEKTIMSYPIEIVLDDDDSSSRLSTASTDSVASFSLSYQDVFTHTPLYHTAIYIKDIPKNTVKQEIVFLLQQYGMLYDIQLNTSKRMAIIKLDTHANAAAAIVGLRNLKMDKRSSIRAGWWTREIKKENCFANSDTLGLSFMPTTFVNNESVQLNQYY